MLDTVKFTFLSMQNTVSIHPIFCRSSLNCHYDISVPWSHGMQNVFLWYQIYFILFVAISKCTNAWSEIKTKPRNKQKPSQICKCYIFFAGHSCTSTFSICVITCRNLVLVPAVIISLCDQIFSMGPRLPKIS